MSTKFPFTQAGVQDLLIQLYALPDNELKAEADELSVNFRAWVIAHFELSESQVSDLEGLHESTVQFMAASTSFAIGNRLAVNLDKEFKIAAKGDPEYKVIETKNNLKVSTGAAGLSRSSDPGFVPEGEVTVRIYYR